MYIMPYFTCIFSFDVYIFLHVQSALSYHFFRKSAIEMPFIIIIIIIVMIIIIFY